MKNSGARCPITVDRYIDPAKASDKRTVQNFRRNILRELKKIKIA